MGSANRRKQRKGKGRARTKALGKKGRKDLARALRGPPLAESANKFELYEQAVQDPLHDVQFLREVYEKVRGRAPHRLREDFCGSAAVCARWVQGGEDDSAEGFDLDEPTLDWGRRRHLEPLGDAVRRVKLHCKDVREPGLHRADVTCAHNFSYQIFYTRQEMLDYLESVVRNLADDGVFVLDMYGGWEATEDLEEERYIDNSDVIYVWDQISYSPVSGRQKCAIHFRFKDRSELRNAFVYEWRNWTMPEMRELLSEVGFDRIDAWFEEYDDEGDGTGVFTPTETGLNCESWLAYLVAYK